MARTLYAAEPADYVANPADGTPIPNALINVWNAATGGTQITDLRAEDGTTAVTQVVADSTGNFRFFGPDPYQAPLWVTTGNSSAKRFLVKPADIASRLVTAEGAITTLGVGVVAILVGSADPSPLPANTLLAYYT